MQETLDLYQNRYQGELQLVAKEQSVRQTMTLVHRIAPQITKAIEPYYRYMRILDDLVDESPWVVPVKETILGERRGLLDGYPPTCLQQQFLGETLSLISPHIQEKIRRHLYGIMSGLLIDLHVRYTQKPLNDRQLKTRNCLDLWPVLAVFTSHLTGKDPRLTPRMIRLMDAWGTYDNISDLVEDLQHGLVLISTEDLRSRNLQFAMGEKLPIPELEQYYKTKRWKVMKELRSSSSAVFSLGLPPLLTLGFFLYFQTRAAKLTFPFMKNDDAKYQPPKDSLIFQANK